MLKKVFFAGMAAGLLCVTEGVSGDQGWYLTRKSPYEANKQLEDRTTNIRDLITNCTERSISLACHRAGIWLVKHGEPARGRKYIENACTLGRGYSCRIVGLGYLDASKRIAEKDEVDEKQMEYYRFASDNAVKYFELGCYRKDKKSCAYLKEIPNAPKLKEGFWDHIFKKH